MKICTRGATCRRADTSNECASAYVRHHCTPALAASETFSHAPLALGSACMRYCRVCCTRVKVLHALVCATCATLTCHTWSQVCTNCTRVSYTFWYTCIYARLRRLSNTPRFKVCFEEYGEYSINSSCGTLSICSLPP